MSITDAAQSPAEELHSRQTRYIVLMSARAGFLVLAAGLAMVDAPWLGLWVGICLVGAVLLPWLAVMIANDRAPRAEYRLANRFRPRPPVIDPVQPALARRAEPRVIDADQ